MAFGHDKYQYVYIERRYLRHILCLIYCHEPVPFLGDYVVT